MTDKISNYDIKQVVRKHSILLDYKIGFLFLLNPWQN